MPLTSLRYVYWALTILVYQHFETIFSNCNQVRRIRKGATLSALARIPNTWWDCWKQWQQWPKVPKRCQLDRLVSHAHWAGHARVTMI